jgi:hypothetical protein
MKLKEYCGTCSSTNWCGRNCGTFKRGLVEGAGPASPEVVAKAKVEIASRVAEPRKAVTPKSQKSKASAVEKVAAAVEEIVAAKGRKAFPPPHPDCEHCKERLRRQADIMRRKRSGT